MVDIFLKLCYFNNMRIAYIGQKGLPTKFGGIERHVESLATGMAENGHDVFVYTRPWYTDKELKEFNGVNLISLPSLKTKNLDAISHTFLASIHALFKDFHIIHYHGVGPALMAWIPRIFKRKAKVIITFHCKDALHEKWGPIARFFLRLGEFFAVKFADETITVSETLKKYCFEKYKAETTFIPNGTTMPDIVGENIINEKFGLKSGDYIFIAVRLVRHKRLDLLIKAFKKIKTDKKLVIAGGSAFTDEYVKELKKTAADDPRIMFTGYQSGEALEQLFSNAMIFAHPSDLEGLPITVIEAMSYGVPVLVSDIPEQLELIPEDLRPQLTFKRGSAEDLEAKLRKLIENKNWLPMIGQRLREDVREKYNWKKITNETEKFYQEAYSRNSLKKTRPIQINL